MQQTTTFWLDCRYSCRDCPALMMTGRNLTNDGQPDVGWGLVALVVSGAGVQQGVLLLHTPTVSRQSGHCVHSVHIHQPCCPNSVHGRKNFSKAAVSSCWSAQNCSKFCSISQNYRLLSPSKECFCHRVQNCGSHRFWKDPDPSKRPDPTVYSKLTVVPDEKRAIAERCGPWTLYITTDLR